MGAGSVQTSEATAFDGAAPLPTVVTIETTRYCNLHCRMCLQYSSGSTARGPHLSLDAFAEIAAKVFPFVKVWQPSVSGEPMLTKDFDTMLAIAAQHRVQLDVTTNGTIWNDALRDAVARSLHLIQFSFDAVDPALFATIREGARRDDVIQNLRALRRRCEELRPHDMPRFGLSVTLMRDNVEQLPELVDFAATELGVDHLQVMHVFAANAAMRAQSLVHAPELARRCIDAAVARAEVHGLDLVVHPFDEVTELVATSAHEPRPVGTGTQPPLCDGVRLLRDRGTPAAAPTPPPTADLPARIGHCAALWGRSYVSLGGEVLACCVPGAPVVGSIWNGDLPTIWNGPLYRELRRRVVARNPAPVCRGCRAYHEITDAAQIARVLGASRVPTTAELGAVSPQLDPLRCASTPRRDDPPPELHWPAAPAGPDPVPDTVIEFSSDRFVSIVFTTTWLATAPTADHWRVPEDLWRQAPRDRTLFWRVRRGASGPIVATGRIAAACDGSGTSRPIA